MKLTEVKEILKNQGIEVEERTTMKNGKAIDALSIGEGHIRPTIYARSVESIESEDELMDFVERIISSVPDIATGIIQDRDYILDHCRSCIRHQSEDDSIIKWSVWGDLEEYIRIDLGEEGNGSMSCVVTKALLSSVDICPDELRTYARRNLRDKASIRSMTEVLVELTGHELPEEMIPSDELMYVATTSDNKSYGAAVMLLKDVLQNFCEEHHLDSVIIIPSSTSEILLVKANHMDDDQINAMISEVNTQVDEFEQLSSHFYLYQAVAA